MIIGCSSLINDNCSKLILSICCVVLEGKVDETSIDQAKYQAAQSVIQAAAVEKLKKEGEEYLTANKAKEGVKVTASGLQYKVNTAGEGASPIASDKLKFTTQVSL